MPEFAMSPIDPAKNRGWAVSIDGVETNVGMITLTSKLGTLTYGQRPEGYDAWVFREVGGGGAVTIPYSITPSGDILVGFTFEARANMGDQPVACAIGGFVDPGEAHKDAQARETAEETGVNALEAWEISGARTNSNRAFFVCDASEGEGVHMYGLRIPYEQLEEAGMRSFRILRGATALLPNFKKEGDVRLLPWREAIRRSPDGLFQAGVARLIAEVL